MSITAPVLDTDRLRLRAHRVDDFADSLALWAAPEVYRYTSGKPGTETQVWQRILAFTGHWKLLGFGYWAVTEKQSGRYLGEAGLADFRREIEPRIHGIPEAGWVFAPHAHGQGFAREAMQAILAWAEPRLGARTVCLIHPENESSLRLAGRLGYREKARATYLGEPTLLLER